MMGIIGHVESVILSSYCLFRGKLFLRLASLLFDMIIIVFNYDVVMLINTLFLWLHNSMYARYFDYVLQ